VAAAKFTSNGVSKSGMQKQYCLRPRHLGRSEAGKTDPQEKIQRKEQKTGRSVVAVMKKRRGEKDEV
jgi:hypothetical protein